MESSSPSIPPLLNPSDHIDDQWRAWGSHGRRSQGFLPRAISSDNARSWPLLLVPHTSIDPKSITDNSSENTESTVARDDPSRLEFVTKTPDADIRQTPPESPQHTLNPWHYFSSASTILKRRKETIIDDAPVLRKSLRLRGRGMVRPIGRKCLIICTTPQQRFENLPFSQSTEKRFREVPSSAPRLVETKGIYTFRKGIRIRDYYIPPLRLPAPGPDTLAYQCRDRFERLDAARTSSAKVKEGPPGSSQDFKIDSPSNTSAVELMSQGTVPRTLRSYETPHPIFIQDRDSGHTCNSTSLSSPIIKQEDEDAFERWLAQDPGNVDRKDTNESQKAT